ncbi:MAG: hypothetical protein RPR97_01950 [Colwellia sp.]
MMALDGKSATHHAFGKKFISYINNNWQYISDIPTDYYLPNEWYKVTFTRTSMFYQFSIQGNFKNAGQMTLGGKINIRKNCVYHYNQTRKELEPRCVDNRTQKFLNKKLVAWPKGSAYSEYFILGEPPC